MDTSESKGPESTNDGSHFAQTDIFTPQRRKLYYYEGYFQTFPAIIRMTEIGFMLIAVCLSCADNKSLAKGGSWLVITTLCSLFVSLFFLIFHLFLVHQHVIAPWALIEFYVGLIVCLILFSGAILSAAYSYIGSVLIALTVIMFLALAFYIVDELVAFKILTAGRYYE